VSPPFFPPVSPPRKRSSPFLLMERFFCLWWAFFIYFFSQVSFGHRCSTIDIDRSQVFNGIPPRAPALLPRVCFFRRFFFGLFFFFSHCCGTCLVRARLPVRFFVCRPFPISALGVVFSPFVPCLSALPPQAQSLQTSPFSSTVRCYYFNCRRSAPFFSRFPIERLLGQVFP